MIPSLPSPLPPVDQALLKLTLRFVPKPERNDWMRCWQAELWHRHYHRSRLSCGAADLYSGLIRDAIWLRMESLRQALAGTAFLCVTVLCCFLVLVTLPLVAFLGSWHALLVLLGTSAARFLFEAVLVTLVSFGTSQQGIEHSSSAVSFVQIRGQMFLIIKLVLVLLIAFFLSTDLSQPFHAMHPFTAEVLQPQLFVLMALLGLRWNLQDQKNRCKHCLHELAAPARVGRPSWNFLDSNGTELICKDGHGLLSIPEIETSWRESSRWIAS